MPRAPKGPPRAGLNLAPNPLVNDLAEQLRTSGPQSFVPQADELGATAALAASPDVPEFVTFDGYLGATITHPSGAPPDDFNQWCVLYRDLALRSWLLVEKAGVVRRLALDDKNVTEDPRDVIWVKAETAVGRGSGSMSNEAKFLTGVFTRAGTLEAGPSGSRWAAPQTTRGAGVAGPVAQPNPYSEGRQAGIGRAADNGLAPPSGLTVENALTFVRNELDASPDPVHPRFAAFSTEAVVVAAAARENYNDPPLTSGEVSSFLRVFSKLLNSFRHA